MLEKDRVAFLQACHQAICDANTTGCMQRQHMFQQHIWGQVWQCTVQVWLALQAYLVLLANRYHASIILEVATHVEGEFCACACGCVTKSYICQEACTCMWSSLHCPYACMQAAQMDKRSDMFLQDNRQHALVD